MKLYITLIIFLLPIISVGQNFEYNIGGIPELKIQATDSVKSVQVYAASKRIVLKPIAPKQKGRLLYQFDYDKYGRQINTYEYDSEDRVITTYNFTYDSLSNYKTIEQLNAYQKLKKQWVFKNDRLINKTEYSNKKKVKQRTTYTFANDTLLKSRIILNKNKDTIYKVVLSYNQQNQLIERLGYSKEKLKGVQKLTYNEDGKINRAYFYPHNQIFLSSSKWANKINEESVDNLNGSNLPFGFSDYYYNEGGKLQLVKQFNPDSTLKYTIKQMYNKKEKLKEIQIFKEESTVIFRAHEYVYNSLGKLIEYRKRGELFMKPIVVEEKKLAYSMNGRLDQFIWIDKETGFTRVHNFEYIQ